MLIILGLLVAIKTLAQQPTHLSNLVVSIDTTQRTSVGHILNQLNSMPNLNFAFDESEIDMNKKVSIPANKDLTVDEIMKIVSSATGMTYTVVGKQIVLKKEEPTEKQKFTISGQIRDAETGEDLIGATIRIEGQTIGTVSNVYGFYSLTLEQGEYNVVYSFVGFDSKIIAIDLSGNVSQNVELGTGEQVLTEVVVTAEKEADFNVTSMEMSTTDVSIETVKKMPALFGEVDIIKTIQLLPGVKTVGEGNSGFYVRGGNVDQNLVLLDESPIYNASHVLGFFSAFNPETVKDMKLYKGAIPALYGGRLSSVLDIRMKEGNSKKFEAAGGIGTLMTRLAVQAPLTKKGSFMIGGRRSYIDVMAKTANAMRGKKTNDDEQFFFYDLNAKANYRINDKNRFFASGYFGRDVLSFEDNTEKFRVDWGNSTATLRWNHVFSPRLFSNLTYYYSNYNYNLDYNEDVSFLEWDANLQEHSVKADLGVFINPQNTMKFGASTIFHKIRPGNMKSFQSEGNSVELDVQTNRSYETAFYLSNEQSISPSLMIEYGIRYSVFQNVGPQEVIVLDDNYDPIDTVNHQKGVYNSWGNFEPRAGLRYQLNSSSSIKASYNRTAQYIQLASNGNFTSPFDVWFPSSEQIKPQLADQYAIGFFKNLRDNAIELSAEVYYKDFQNSIDFKDHAELLLNENLEGDLRIGVMRAYGFELMAKKNSGRLTGWVSYSLSKAEKKIETINNNDWYNAKHDKPHDVSVVASFELNDRWTFGGNFVYSTGSPVTFPTGRYVFQGVAVPVYSERNSERLPDYHRMDISATLRGRKNDSRRLQTEWVFSLYNVYGRKNAFNIAFKQEEANPNVTYAEKQSIFGIVPSITFNARF